MSKYRICPYGLIQWKVQKQCSYNEFIWEDVLEDGGSFSIRNIVKVFSSEQAAEQYIDTQRHLEALAYKAKRREEDIKPRAYP